MHINRTQNSGHLTPMTATATYLTLIQHWAAPHHTARPHTPNSCISHYLSGGLRVHACFPFPRSSSLYAHSSSRHPPFLAHTSLYTPSSPVICSPPPFLTTWNRAVHSLSISDHKITAEPLSTPNHCLFCVALAQFSCLPSRNDTF